ncbi:PepSY domain-containing protein [Thermopolyspora sp. NPDC052614]|uniref:PepSY domain-containing protein n=1 Tax=Thermopolyspora sp. NPDC052614 TaxID=3155682 RepID=UPI0034460645
MRNTMKLVIAGVGVVAVLGGGSAIAAASAAPSGVSVTTGATADLSTATASSTTTAKITRKQAIAIAKKRVPGARVTEVEREWEHGYHTWKIELHKGAWEYDVYVAVSNGRIIKFKQKHDD